jgi:hypothetical protein
MSKHLQERFRLFENLPDDFDHGGVPPDVASLAMARKVVALLSNIFAEHQIADEPDVGLVGDGRVEITCPPSAGSNHVCFLLDMTVPEIFIYTPPHDHAYALHKAGCISRDTFNEMRVGSSGKILLLSEKDEDKQAAEIVRHVKILLLN